MPGVSTPDVPVLILNRKPQTYKFPRHKPLVASANGTLDTSLDFVDCPPGLSLSSRDQVHAAAIDTMNPYPRVIRPVWLGEDPPEGYTTMRDLGETDTLRAIAGTHDLRILDALAGSGSVSAVVREQAHARAESIRSGKPSALGQSVAQDEGENSYDLGRVG